VWSVIVSVVNDGAATFVRSTSYITGTNFSIDLYIGRTIFKTAINFGHHIILYFLALLILPLHVGWTALLAVIGIALLFLNAYWAVVVFAFLSARFRDVELILRNLLQLAFFMTPVFWNYRQLAADRKFIVDYNLLYYYIEIVRAPLLGEVPPLGHYLVVLGCTILGYLLAIATYRRMRRQLAFFVS
jgi:ABC-type polysaccharide/polyol phosphate export permease